MGAGEHGLPEKGVSPTRVDLLVGGAGRGAQRMQAPILDFNTRSRRLQLRPGYVDPESQRACQLARVALALGLPASGVEDWIEDVIARDGASATAPVILHVDRPETTGAVLEALTDLDRAVLGYGLIRTPSQELLGVAIVLQAGESHLKTLGALFHRRLADVTARCGSGQVLGEHGRSEHLASEPAYRAWFARHLEHNLPKVLTRSEPESAPFEISRDGQQAMPLLIVDHRQAWMDPLALIQEVTVWPGVAIVPGTEFVVGEMGPDGIRLHRMCRRVGDGRVSIGGVAICDPVHVTAGWRRERAERALTAVSTRAARETVTRLNPVFMTD